MRDLGPEWRLEWRSDLPPDMYGFTDFGRRTITIARGLTFEERRCTITHEVEHALRGPASSHSVLREELLVDRRASRLLLPCVRELADAMVFHGGDYEAVSEELWVDPWTLEVRMSALGESERHYFRERMGDVMLG